MKTNKHYELFESICKNEAGEYLPWELLEKGVRVDIAPIRRTNVTLTGLSLIIPGQNMGPTIYVEHLYKKFLSTQGFSGDEGFDRNQIICFLRERIEEVYHNCLAKNIQLDEILNPENIKANVFYRLINGPANEELLKKVPHREGFHEFILVYHLFISSDKCNGGVANMLIHDDLAQMIGFSEEDLYQCAVKNTPRLFPAVINPIEKELLGLGCFENEKSEDDMIREAFDFSAGMPFAVISNDKKSNGAGVVLYDNLLSRLADAANADLILLPSSVHEFLAVPYFEDVDINKFIGMVKEVNETQVAEEERLSDNVYVFRRKEGLISCLSTFKLVTGVCR